jgi:O-antigen ligase
LPEPTFNRIKRLFTICVVVQIIGLLFSIAVSSIAFATACVLFLYLVVSHRSEILQRTGLEWFFGGYIFAVFLMVLFAIYPLEALNNSRRVLLIAVVYFIPIALSTEGRIRKFLLVFALIAALQSMIEIGAYYLKASERLGFFQHYMTAAGMKMFVLLLILPFVFFPETGKKERWCFAASSAIMLYAFFLTQTRSSWIGFFIGAAFIGIVAYRKLLIALAVVMVLFLLLAPGRLRERIDNMFATKQGSVASATVESNQNRLRMWKTGWQMFQEHPVFGVGDGDVGRVYRYYVPDASPDEGGHLHNTYMHILASHGAIGFAAVLALFFAIALFEWKVWRKARLSFAGVLAIGCLACFLAFLANGFGEYNFGDHEILVLLWMTVGLSVTANMMTQQSLPLRESDSLPLS